MKRKPLPLLINIVELKKMAREAETIAASMPHDKWRAAYLHIAQGTSMLWRLIDQCEKNYGPGPEDMP